MKNLHHLGITLTVAALLTAAPINVALGEGVQMTMSADDVQAVTHLPEMGGVVLERDSTLTIEFLLEPNKREADYREVNLQAGDIILMMNGKRMRTAADLDSILAGMKAGEMIQMGVKRGHRTHMVSFAKGDPGKLPKTQVMTMSMDGAAAGGGKGGPKVITRTIGGPGGGEEMVILMGSGFVARKDGDRIVVGALMPHAKKSADGSPVAEGDEIVSLQGKPVKSLADLQERFDGIEEGSEVALGLKSGAKEINITFTKEMPEGMIIKKSE